MSANIMQRNGQDAIAYFGSTPWHSLGTRITGDQSKDFDAVLKLASLDYTVETAPLYLADGRKVAQGQAVLRDDKTVLSVVGPAYEPVQNAEALGIMRDVMKEFGVTIECAGALGDGEKAWMLCRLPDVNLNPSGQDRDDIRGYFLAATSHDGSSGVTGRPTPIRVVCQNTLTLAFNGNKRPVVSVRHSKNAQARLDEAARLVTQMTKALQASGDTYASLARRKMGAKDLAAYIEAVFPESAVNIEKGRVSDVLAQRRATVAELVFSGKGADLAGSDANGTTPWAAYNAVVEYFDHVRPAEAKSRSARIAAQESAIFGGNFAIKQKALELAQVLVAA